MSDTITRRIPPQRLITAMNPLVRAVAGSRLHRLIDANVLILHITGRRSGRQYHIPVGFADLGDALLIVTQHPWRANLRDATEVTVTRQGWTRQMHVQLEEDPSAVAGLLGGAIGRLGRTDAQRRFGLTLPEHRDPDPAELEAAVREFSLAAIILRDGD